MSDITQAAIQDEIANSLLGPQVEPEPEPSYFAGDSVDLLNSAIEEQQHNPEIYGDGDAVRVSEPEARRDERAQQQAETDESWRPQNQPKDPLIAQLVEERRSREGQQQETQPQTPEQIHEGIQALDTVVREHSLNDPAAAKDFATDFCGAFGSDPYKSGVNVEGLGSVMAKTAFSALNAYQACNGDISQLGPIPAESARAFTAEFLRAWGVDSRGVQVNEQMLSETVFRGVANFIDTYNKLGGRVASLDQLNTPEAAEWFLGNFLQAFGAPANTKVDRATALKFADAGGKYLLSFMTKVRQMQPQAQQRSSQRGRSSQRVPKRFQEAIKGRRSPKFQTNSRTGDPFDDETMQAWAHRSGRL